MTWPTDLTLLALAHPDSSSDWPPDRWSRMFRHARSAGLLSRVADSVTALSEGARNRWPDPLNAHLQAAERVCRAQQREIHRESRFIAKALTQLGAPVILLKGAAYVMAGLPAARGRVFSDIDILVPKEALANAESLLMQAGWMTTQHNAYDQRYYREWMHELPPMEHVHRQTVLDVHHTILPETASLRPDPRLLFEASIPLPDVPGLRVLSSFDMVLHSMTHLFMNDDMSHALRDLSDLDLLLRHFGRDADFWPGLVQRAQALQLQRPLFYGLRYTARCLGTPVPAAAVCANAGAAPPRILRLVMDTIWLRVLRSPHPEAAPRGRVLALLALYARGHWLRMPPLMLIRHLTIKAIRTRERKADPG